MRFANPLPISDNGSLSMYIYGSFTSRGTFSGYVTGICRIRPLPTPCACLARFLPHVELGTYVSGFNPPRAMTTPSPRLALTQGTTDQPHR